MGEFKWYDWAVIYLISDISAALIIAILTGAAAFGVMILPLLVLAWLSYENFRRTQYDKESD